MTTTRIKASLGQKLIANADRYYTARIPQIIDELVQNARRAGAKTLWATLRGDATLVLADDGRGLEADKAPVLIRLGGSDNDEQIETAENAAGVGFFSLAHCDVLVRSRDWSMTIPRDAFVGKADAILRGGEPPIQGMTIEIAGLHGRPDYHALEDGSSLIAATRYSGLVLILDGFKKADGIHQPRDFLADGLVQNAQMLRQDTDGLSIQLVRAYFDDRDKVQINFFGKVIKPDLASAIGLITEEIGELIERKKPQAFSIVRNTYRTKVRIDVRDTSVLRLQLPERNALISDEGCDRVIKTLQAMYLKLLCQIDGPNGIPRSAEIRKKASGRIPAPTLAIRSGLERRGSPPESIGISHPEGMRDEHGVIIPFERLVRVPGGAMLTAYLTNPRAKALLGDRVFVLNEDVFNAYGEDRVNTLTDYEITMKYGGDEHRFSVEGVIDADVHAGLNDAEIEIDEAVIEDASLSFRIGAQAITIPICAVLAAEDSMEDCAVVWPVADASSHEVVDLMVESLEWDDEEGDWKDNRHRAWRTYTAQIANLMGQNRALFIERLKERLYDLSFDHLLAMNGGESLAVSVAITRGEHGFDIAVTG